MTSPADDIAQILHDDGIGVRATDLYVNDDPGNKTLTIAVYDTPGFDPNPKWLRDHPTVQVRIRGAVHGSSAAYDKALAVKDALLGRPTTVVNSKNYVQFIQMGDITFVGADENNQPIFVTNWRLAVESSTGGNREAL